MMKLETSIQDNKTIQNLKFNTETKLVRGGPQAGRSHPPDLQGATRAFLCVEPDALLPLPPPARPPPSSPFCAAVCLCACLAQAAFPGR